MSLFTDLVAAGVECGSWQSDLYFPRTEVTTAILAKHPLQKMIAHTFRSNINDALTYEVPFAYDPYWEKHSALPARRIA